MIKDELRAEFDAFILKAANQRAQVIEQAFEAAIQGGEHGVLVVTDNSLTTIKTTASVSPLVPYGQIHEVPADGLDAYLDRQADPERRIT